MLNKIRIYFHQKIVEDIKKIEKNGKLSLYSNYEFILVTNLLLLNFKYTLFPCFMMLELDPVNLSFDSGTMIVKDAGGAPQCSFPVSFTILLVTVCQQVSPAPQKAAFQLAFSFYSKPLLNDIRTQFIRWILSEFYWHPRGSFLQPLSELLCHPK